MLLLSGTSDLVRVITDATCTVEVQASWVDRTTADVITPDRLNTPISTATTTTVVGSPAASTQRNVKQLSIKNDHASTSVNVDVIHTDGTNPITIFETNLLAGEMAVLDATGKWTVYDSSGLVKISAGVLTVRALAADQSNSTTTPTEVTGLKLTGVGPGTYQFIYQLVYQAGATTTGVKFSVNHDGTVTSFVANLRWVDVSALAATAVPSQAAVGAAGQVMGAMSARAKSTAGWGVTLSVDAATSDMLITIDGNIVVTVAGELELWHGSEVAAQTTVKAGSSVVLTKCG